MLIHVRCRLHDIVRTNYLSLLLLLLDVRALSFCSRTRRSDVRLLRRVDEENNLTTD